MLIRFFTAPFQREAADAVSSLRQRSDYRQQLVLPHRSGSGILGLVQHQAASGHVKVPLEVMEEVRVGRRDNDPLLDWISQDDNVDTLLLEEAVDAALVRQVVSIG
jgi:hypothetical protein